MIARASSGSRSCSSSVEPLMSANSAVTVLRSPPETSAATGPATTLISAPAPAPGGGTWLEAAAPLPAGNGAPQPPQYFSSGSFDAPHREHFAVSGEPHSAQKRRPSRLPFPHLAQRIFLRSEFLEQ